MSVTQIHNPGFFKSQSHNLITQDFPNVRHTISEHRIFHNVRHTTSQPRIFPNVRHTISQPRIFPNVRHTISKPRIFPNVRNTISQIVLYKTLRMLYETSISMLIQKRLYNSHMRSSYKTYVRSYLMANIRLVWDIIQWRI